MLHYVIIFRFCLSYVHYDISVKVLSKLHCDPLISHEEFKGALYLILQNQLLVKHNWQLQVDGPNYKIHC